VHRFGYADSTRISSHAQLYLFRDPDIMKLRAAFDKFDATKDGIISYAEFKQALEKMNYSEETLKEIFASVVSR
jgi:Ca2+-binding EF-hand superfamily protein